MTCVLLTACISEYNAHGTSQVEGGVPGMGVLMDNRPRRARAGAARCAFALLSAGGNCVVGQCKTAKNEPRGMPAVWLTRAGEVTGESTTHDTPPAVGPCFRRN